MSVVSAHTPTAAPMTAIPGHTQRHEIPAWINNAATAAPHRAPVLNKAWSRTSVDGWSTSRCEASAFMAVSMLPPAIITGTSTSENVHLSSVRGKMHRSADQAKRATHNSRRAPTRSARWAVNALDPPATATATESNTPNWASFNE